MLCQKDDITLPNGARQDTDSHFSRLLSSERRQSPEVDVTNALDEKIYDDGGVGIKGDRDEGEAAVVMEAEAADVVEVDDKKPSMSTAGAPSGLA